MKKKYKHSEELRKFWREAKRRYRAKKRAEEEKAETNNPKIKHLAPIFKNGEPWLMGEIVDEVPPIKRKRRKQK